MTIIKYLLTIPLTMLALTVYMTIGLAFCNMAVAILHKLKINTFIFEDFLKEGVFVWIWPVLMADFLIRMFFVIPLKIAQKIVKPKEKPDEQAAKATV